MSNSYRRATRQLAARIQLMDGSVQEGSLLLPIGVEFEELVMSKPPFIEFLPSGGEKTFINIAGILSIARTAAQTEDAKEEERRKRDAEKSARTQADKGYSQSAGDTNSGLDDKPNPANARKSKRRAYTNEEYSALDMLKLTDEASRDEIQAAYRKMAKLYHPDRLRGLGVAEDKIDYAARRLAEINTAYRMLMKAAA